MRTPSPSSIVARIDQIEGRYLETNLPIFDPTEGFADNMFFVPVLGLSRFWNHDQTAELELWQCQQKLVAGLKDSGAGWSFVVIGDARQLRLYLGLSGGGHSPEMWNRYLLGVFPGCRLGETEASDHIFSELVQRPHIAALTGNPAIRKQTHDVNQPSAIPSLEILYRSMRGSRWAYLVIGQPVSDSEIADGLTGVEQEIRETVSTFLRPGSAEEHNNPDAQRYLDLLRAAQANYVEGQGNGLWDLQAYLLAGSNVELFAGMQTLAGVFSGPESKPEPVRVRVCTADLSKRPAELAVTRLTTREASLLACLPANECAGFEIREQASFALSRSQATSERNIAVGCVLNNDHRTDNWFEVGVDDLCKHSFVAGVTRSGKTATCQYLLRQLWEDYGIPWLVLEPSVKSEYRRLLNSPLAKDLRIFTLGEETGVPFRINPLEVQPGIHVQAHIDALLCLLNAAFAWVTPMPVVLSHTLNRVYEDFGWDLAMGTHPIGYAPEAQPSLEDLIARIEIVVDELEYDPEIKGNLKGGLKLRLSSMTLGAKGRMLDSRISFPMEYLLSKPTILEFSSIGNDEEKAFLLGSLLLRMEQFRRVQGLSGGRLVHVALLEEAHRLLSAVPQGLGEEQANPKAKAVEQFCNLLAEAGAYGQGLIIVDQIPTKLAPDVIKNTNLKICHRLVAADDRKQMAGTMNLNLEQERFLATLQTGEAVAYREGREQAFVISVPDHVRRLGFHESSPTKHDIIEHMKSRLPDLPIAKSPKEASQPISDAPSLAPCPNCVNETCKFRNAMLQELFNGDHSEAFEEAVNGGYVVLWEFGVEIAKCGLGVRNPPPRASFCAIMSLCSIARYNEVETERICRNMRIMLDATLNRGTTHG